MIYKEAVINVGCLTDEGKAYMHPNRSLPVEYYYQAMMEAESDDAVQRCRWRGSWH